jgi:hypothetical protein
VRRAEDPARRDDIAKVLQTHRIAVISLIEPSVPIFVDRGVVFAADRLFVFLTVESRVVPAVSGPRMTGTAHASGA